MKLFIRTNTFFTGLPFLFLSCLFVLIAIQGFSQEADTIDYITESNKIYKSSIKSLQIHRKGWDLSPPLILFNSGEKLKLSFDDMEVGAKEYTYTIIHCNANWKPSDLDQYEYIDGYYEDYIYEFDYSYNTLRPFTHYHFVFPTEDLKPTRSGNYILKVYYENPDSIYFTRRFMIVDQKIDINANVKQASLIADRNYKQEVDFELVTKNYSVSNPFTGLKIAVLQNERQDNAIRDLKPKMMIGNKINYDYDRENVFNGGNEFREADIKSMRYNSGYVASIDKDYEGYLAYLMPEEKRTFEVYKTIEDINGKMKIKTEDGDNSDTEADYIAVHFYLSYPVPLIDGDIHIYGALTDRSFSDESKMAYNFKEKAYVKTLILKQGYYNYQYIFLPNGKSAGDETFIEANHWETENDYTIYVYYRQPGENYDRLIGVKHINSIKE